MRYLFFLSFSVLVLMPMELLADGNGKATINLEHKHKGGPRSDFPLYNDMPQAFHDLKYDEIIIIGDGAVSYYDVEISSVATSSVEITTTVDGTYDTFDISSLSAGSHVITIAEKLPTLNG